MAYESSRIPFADRRGVNVWPDGARMAVLVYAAAEQWVWTENEPLKPAGTFAAGRNAAPSLSSRMAVEYGYEVGLRRIHEIFRDFGMRTTLWTSGVTAERYPALIRDFVSDGHELGAHGYSQGQVIGWLSRADQWTAINRTAEALEKVAGHRPMGWISPGAECSDDTVELLAEAGFDYHGDLQDDELPYFVHTGGRSLVEVPYRLVGNLNDLSLVTRNVNSVTAAVDILRDAFDAYYLAAAERPLVFNYGTHPYISGRPDNARIMRCFLEYVHQHKDVWITSYGELAAWWRANFEGKISAGRGAIDVLAQDQP
jgi:peptidoglycan/xylan/chitin deacetylase (PgdA/CDA1 family)